MHQRKRKVFFINDSGRQRRKDSNLQHTSKKLQKKRNFPSKWIAWKVLKTVIFVICLIFFFVQSTNFLTNYYEYPTTTRFTVMRPKMFKMPCITFCNDNPIKRSKFCSEYPHLCEPPSNLTEFCSKQAHMCSRNISDLVIPKLGYYASDATDEINTILEILYENRNMSQEAWSNWTWDIPTGLSKSERQMIASLVYRMDRFPYQTCYSANLRFSNKLPASLWHIGKEIVKESFILNVEEDESFYPWKTPKYKLAIHSPFVPIHPVAEGKALEIGHSYEIGVKLEDESFYPWKTPKYKLAIHSPFVPIHPVAEGKALEIGHSYEIGVKLEEEHLLPHPYQTDCTDYIELWKENNQTGPRSQEICSLWCIWNNNGDCRKLPPSAKMVEYSVNMCELNSQNHNQGHECWKNCKEDCEKLKYSYKLSEFPMDEHEFGDKKRHSIFVFFLIDDPQVVVISHIPLYYAGDLFSHIGGLMGFWLSISVATLAGILESTFKEVKHLTWKLGRYVK